MADELANIVKGATVGRTKTFALTTSSAAHAIPDEWGAGTRFITLVSPVAFYYVLGDGSDTVDETATSGDTQCTYVEVGQQANIMFNPDERDGAGNLVSHLILKGTAAGYVYSHMSSSQR